VNLEHLIRALKSADVDLNIEDVLDALWLATRGLTLSLYKPINAMRQEQAPLPTQTEITSDSGTIVMPPKEGIGPPVAQTLPLPEDTAPVYAPGTIGTGEAIKKGSPVALPAGHALTGRLPLSRALRPFRRRWPSQHQRELDEERTAEMTAELGGQLYAVFRPLQERWFDVDVVLEDDPAIGIWRDTIRDFAQTLRDTGAFRDVRSWRLRIPASTMSPGLPLIETPAGSLRHAHTLAGTGVRRLIFFATHGASERWLDGSYLRVLTPWLRSCSFVLLHLLDRRHWKRVVLGEPYGMCYTQDPGAVTSTLRVERFWWALADEKHSTISIPVAPLTPSGLAEWSHMQMARGGRCAAILLDPNATSVQKVTTASAQDYERAVSLLREASPDAFRLAVYLCSGPFTIPVARLVQEAKFGAVAQQQHLVEVLLSGLVFARSPQEPNVDPNDLYYDFDSNARAILMRSLRAADAEIIGNALEQRVSRYIEQIYGRTVTFRALVPDDKGNYDLPHWAQPFARLGVRLLGRASHGKTAAQLFEEFRASQPPAVIARAALLASTTPIGNQLESRSTNPALWNVLLKSGLLLKDMSDAWTFLPGIEPLLKRLALTDLLRGVTILWIGDPGEHDIGRFRSLGAALDLAHTEEDAYAMAKRPYNVVILEWVGVLERIRDLSGDIPVIIYAAVASSAQSLKMLQAGALACTNLLEELLELVLDVTGRALNPPLEPRQRQLTEVLRAMGMHRVGHIAAVTAPRALGEHVLGSQTESQAAYQRHLEVIQAIAKSGVNQVIRIEGESLRVVASVIDIKKQNSRYEEAAWSGLIGRAAREGRVVWAPDVSLFPDYIRVEPDTRSELVLPLESSSMPGIIGVVNIEMDHFGTLTEFDIQWLQEFCAPLTPRILQELQPDQQLREEEYRVQRLRSLSEKEDLERQWSATHRPSSKKAETKSTHKLFLIHGMGIHDDDWAEGLEHPIETLKRVSRQYQYFKQADHDVFDERVECVSVHYDDVFRDMIGKWKKDPGWITPFDPTGMLKHIMGWLSSASDEAFWWSHLADLAMYRCSPLYRQAVRITVIKQLAEVIERVVKADGAAYCSVLAHSLGTAVAHDCLHLLGTKQWADGPYANVLGPAHWRFQNIFMVANTSRLLQTEDSELKKAYESIVRPGSLEDPKSYCFAYWNFRHEADPIPYPKRFEPMNWPNYQNEVIRHYYQFNVHNLSHYLLHPRVHIPILNKVVAHRAVTTEETVRALYDFPEFGGDLELRQNAGHMARQLKSLTREITDRLSVDDWVKKLLEFNQLIEAAR
jgi:hypothetical protein